MLREPIQTAYLALGILLLSWALCGCESTGPTTDQTVQLEGQRHQRLARINRQRRAGRFDEAIAAYRALADESTEDAVANARVWHELAVTYGRRADGRAAGESTPASADDRSEALRCEQRASELADGASPAPPIELTAAIGLNLGRCHRLLGHTDQAITGYESLLEHLPADRVERVRTLHELGNAYLERAGRREGSPASGASFGEDLNLALASQAEAIQLTGQVESCPEHLKAWIHNSMGLIGRRQSRLDPAIDHLVQAVTIFRETGDDDQQLTTLTNLIQALLEAGRYERVTEECEKLSALPGASRNPGALSTLGVAELARGHFAEAVKQFDLARFVARRQPRFADDPNFMAGLAANAAKCAQDSGDFARAEELLGQAHQNLTAAGGDPGTAAVIEANLGRMFLTLGRLDQAEEQLQAAFDRQKELYGEQHPDTLLTMLDLAALARERAYFGDAEALCSTAVAGLEAALGSEHPSVGSARMELAAVLMDRGQCQPVGRHAARAVEILDAALGRNHPRSIQTVLQATLYAAACQDTAEGAARFRDLQTDATRRFELLRRSLSPDHVDLLRAMVLFADIKARTPQARAKALEIYQAAEVGFLEAFGDDRHSSLAKLRWGQGRLLAQMDRSDEAFAMYTKALGRLDPSFERHPLRAQLLEGLGDLLEARDDRQQARQYYQQAYRILTATYGTNHPVVKNFEARHGG